MRRSAHAIHIRQDLRRQMLDLYLWKITKQYGTLNDVLQFPHVPRPHISSQCTCRRATQSSRRPLLLTREHLDKRGGQWDYIILPFAQRWQLDLDRVDTVVEVHPETAI